MEASEALAYRWADTQIWSGLATAPFEVSTTLHTHCSYAVHLMRILARDDIHHENMSKPCVPDDEMRIDLIVVIKDEFAIRALGFLPIS